MSITRSKLQSLYGKLIFIFMCLIEIKYLFFKRDLIKMAAEIATNVTGQLYKGVSSRTHMYNNAELQVYLQNRTFLYFIYKFLLTTVYLSEKRILDTEKGKRKKHETLGITFWHMTTCMLSDDDIRDN